LDIRKSSPKEKPYARAFANPNASFAAASTTALPILRVTDLETGQIRTVFYFPH
jgi:hypothetical protein